MSEKYIITEEGRHMYKKAEGILTAFFLTLLFAQSVWAQNETGGGPALLYDDATGNWYVYTDGQIDWDYTGVIENEHGWWYVKDGMLDWNYTGVAQNENGWWYIKDGALDWEYTGLAQNENGWWYINQGALDWNYSGVVQNENGWWYVNHGALDWTYTGVAPNEYGWWYINDGWLNWNYTGLAANEYGWWYIKNGALDWTYTGVAQNENGWWYVNNGALDWSYTGVGENESGWWYINDGWLNWNYNGSVSYKGNTYKVINGWVDQDLSWVNDLDVSKECSQLVVVSVYNTNYATISLHTKYDGVWEDEFSVTGRVGSRGIGKEKEGDKKTPTGVYGLNTAFGIKPDPGCPIGYTQVNENHYWGGKPDQYYNTFVDASQIPDYSPKGAEHIIDYGTVYNYCVAIDYNPEGIVGKGSAIFLHCSGKGATAGCVSMPESNMVTLLRNLRSDAKIVIDFSSNISKY